MMHYHLELALRSFRRNKILTALMVLAIALGIGASMTTLTVLYVLSGDPLPGKSDRTFYVQLDAEGLDGYREGGEPEMQLTRFDAESLLRSREAGRQAMMSGGALTIAPKRSGLSPFMLDARFTSSDFFPMFDVPMRYGSPWSETEDEQRARVVVLSRALNRKLFADEDSVGQTVTLSGTDFRVVGVLGSWRPTPHFYDLTSGNYSDLEQAFVPFSTARDLELQVSGTTNCWNSAGGDQYALHAPCAWVQFWVQFDEASESARYRTFLRSYSKEQIAAGRFERPENIRLRSVMEWLDFREVVPSDVRLQVWIAFGFLLVCLLNTVGLLLAKFMRRGSEIGVRRALGASRGRIVAHLLVESGLIGLVGGVFGLGLVMLGLWGVRQQPTEFASVVHLDIPMLATTFGLALASSVLAGCVPAWRACQVTPALQVKSQ